MQQEKQKGRKPDHTYDDVYRTLLTKCKSLIIPVVNELFGEHFTNDDEVVLLQNEHYLIRKEGNDVKRISDSSFSILSIAKAIVKHYLIECQTKNDKTIVIRIFEYATQIALQDAKLIGNELTVRFPHCAVLYLRDKESTKGDCSIKLYAPENDDYIKFDVPTIRIKDYTLDQIFEKQLYFLLPYYLFNYDNRLKRYNEDEEKLNSLIAEYQEILAQLDELVDESRVTAYERSMIIEMTNKVNDKLAANYDNIRKGIGEIMGGKVLKTRTDEMYQKGQRVAKKSTAINMKNDGIEPSLIAKYLDVAIDQVLEWLGPVPVQK